MSCKELLGLQTQCCVSYHCTSGKFNHSSLDSAPCAAKMGEQNIYIWERFSPFWRNLCFAWQNSTAWKTAAVTVPTLKHASKLWISFNFTLKSLLSLIGTFLLSIPTDRSCQLQANPIEVSPCCSSQVREVGDASGCTHTFLLTNQLLPHWLLHLYHKCLHNPFPFTRINYEENDLGGEELRYTWIAPTQSYSWEQAMPWLLNSSALVSESPKQKIPFIGGLSISLCLAIFKLFSHI